MRKIIFLGTMILLLSCSKQEINQNDACFTIDYYFPDTGTMYSKSATSDAVYQDFKKNYIDTRKVTPTKFYLTFKNEQDGTIAKINGDWTRQEGFMLPAGKYIVNGYSEPAEYNYSSTSDYAVTDTLYLSFSQTIELSAETDEIKLQATYNSYLLLFDKANIQDISKAYTYPLCFRNTENVYFAFISNSIAEDTHPISIIRSNGDKSNLYLDQLNGENGNYYYFRDTDYGFDLPEMKPGI